MREMVARMRQYQTIDPTGFHAVWENVKKGSRLGGTAAPEARGVSRDAPSNVHSPHTTNQQVPSSSINVPHQNAQAHSRSCSAVLSPSTGSMHQTLSHPDYNLEDQSEVKALPSIQQAQAGMPVNPVSLQKPPNFMASTTQSYLPNPSNHNRLAPKTTLRSSHMAQNAPHVQFLSGAISSLIISCTRSCLTPLYRPLTTKPDTFIPTR